MPWAVFLDRDGTVIEYVELVTRPDQVKLIPGATTALRKLREAGALLIMTTNQPVVARELIDEEELRLIHAHMQELLAAEGVELDGLYFCPHHPETHHPEAQNPEYRRDCECRKPKAGMMLEAAKHFDIDLPASYVVGDSTRDIGAAEAAGCVPVLVRTGVAGEDGNLPDAKPAYVADDLGRAADWILEQKAQA